MLIINVTFSFNPMPRYARAAFVKVVYVDKTFDILKLTKVWGEVTA